VRRRLAVVALAVTALIVVSFVVPLGILVRRQAEDRELSRAEGDARSIATALAVTTAFGGTPADAATAAAVLDAFGMPPNAAIFLADGTVVGLGDPADSDVAVAREGTAFTADTPDGAAVLVPVITSDAVIVIRIAVPEEDLHEGVARAWLILGLLALLLIAVAVAAADRLGRSIVDPVARLRRATSSLAAGDLEARVRPDGPPEIAEVSRAFNDLAERLGDLLQAEREAAADVSHGLRTPLTALRLQVEGLSDPQARAQLTQDVTTLERAVDEVIREARSRSDEAVRHADLSASARSRAEFWSVLASEQRRRLTLDVPAVTVPIHTTPSDAVTVVDTLLDNVFTHTPPGTDVVVRVDAVATTLVVEDGGLGFDPAEQTRGTSGTTSTGLGLDIVRRIAERSGGSMIIGRSALGGAKIEIRFGVPDLGGSSKRARE
jgi:signal transduction histidine kinase